MFCQCSMSLSSLDATENIAYLDVSTSTSSEPWGTTQLRVMTTVFSAHPLVTAPRTDWRGDIFILPMKTSGGSQNVKVYNIFGRIFMNFRLFKYVRPSESIHCRLLSVRLSTSKVERLKKQ